MAYRRTLSQVLRRISPQLRERGRIIRKFSDQLGMVYFGVVDQHDDDHSAIRGFSASLTHSDTHYAVGTYEGHDIRIVDRLDILHIPGHDNHQQVWTIVEVDLATQGIPHVFFVPTGKAGPEYARLFASQPYLQPLNSALSTQNRSPEFHGRYQILARTTHSHQIEQFFSSPTIVGIGARFWPYGIEIQHGKLFVYLSDSKLTKQHLQSAVTSAIWLADLINESSEDI